MGRCRNASSAGESNNIALMLRGTEPYTGGVRVGKGFHVEVPHWSGPIIKAPLFEVQTDDWECFCCVFWDPIHAGCAAPQELETDEIMKQLEYIRMDLWHCFLSMTYNFSRLLVC